jgi:hypothetical protein
VILQCSVSKSPEVMVGLPLSATALVYSMLGIYPTALPFVNL